MQYIVPSQLCVVTNFCLQLLHFGKSNNNCVIFEKHLWSIAETSKLHNQYDKQSFAIKVYIIGLALGLCIWYWRVCNTKVKVVLPGRGLLGSSSPSSLKLVFFSRTLFTFHKISLTILNNMNNMQIVLKALLSLPSVFALWSFNMKSN